MNGNSKIGIALGFGFIVTGAVTIVTLIFIPNANWRVYASLIIAFPIFVSAFYIPAMRLTWHEWNDARTQSLPPKQGVGEVLRPETGRTINLRRQAWQDWFVTKLEFAKKVGGIHYSGAMDGCMDYELWREYFHRVLFGAGFAGPIVNRARTNLLEGVTIEGVIVAIKAGAPLPYPEDADPPGYTEPQKQAENTTFVYNKDI